MISSRHCRDFAHFMFDDQMLEPIVEWVCDNLEPDDVFSKKELEEWARSNGFVEEE